ncbi:hypothetical protein QL189_09010 [Cronobacter turicensis]|uniref:hypothetical protein n=1 Tax=Cronobacter turicensis TaxID=413502 RepID=UPI0024A84C7E|nr:hypothetical protein [Cronobacter turicensis]MDI6417521.1 hypothetical protein [Cronobacter turicensis]MDI6464018.1 hypothetical protein [Cronobacter turicensis]MDI7673217.1 hypothetical protein [Cronobacter turicensis]
MSEDVIVFVSVDEVRIDQTDRFIDASADESIVDESGIEYKVRLFDYLKQDEGLLYRYWYAAEDLTSVDASEIMLAVNHLKPRPASVSKL